MSLSHNPSSKNYWFRLFPLRSPLLGESLLISLPSATKLFQFAEFARAGLWIQPAVQGGCPIRRPPDNCLLPAPRSISLVATSFFASVCLGIHRKPFVAWPQILTLVSVKLLVIDNWGRGNWVNRLPIHARPVIDYLSVSTWQVAMQFSRF